MRLNQLKIFILSLVLALAATAVAVPASAFVLPFDARVEAYGLETSQGRHLILAVIVEPDEAYHAYANDPGETGRPTTLSITSSSPELGSDIRYPAGESQPDIFDPTKTVNVYEGTFPLFVDLGDHSGQALDLAMVLNMLLCSDVNCIPVRHDLAFAATAEELAGLPSLADSVWYESWLGAGGDAGVAVEAEQGTGNAEDGLQALDIPELSPRYAQQGLEVTGLFKAMLFALLAGLILNFMPCVLPVISLKLSTLMSAGSSDDVRVREQRFRRHNLSFAAGVLVFFVLLGFLLAGAGLAWGQHFQTPEVVLVLAVVVFTLGLSLFGVFTLPIIDLKGGSGNQDSAWSAFATGMIATLLATPCSGPFLGGVLGWALLQPFGVILAVFLAIGLGMASPYLLMSLRPGLVRFFPRPGPWVGKLEKLVAFFLMATTVYLLNILPDIYDLNALILLLTAAFAAWMWGGWTGLADSTRRRTIIRSLAVALMAVAFALALTPDMDKDLWQDFDSARFSNDFGKQAMLLDFTAEWCPNCKFLEQTTLTDANVREWVDAFGVLPVKVDLTNSFPEAEALLEMLGSQSIPVLAIFPAGEDAARPLVLRDLVTGDQVEKALREAIR